MRVPAGLLAALLVAGCLGSEAGPDARPAAAPPEGAPSEGPSPPADAVGAGGAAGDDGGPEALERCRERWATSADWSCLGTFAGDAAVPPRFVVADAVDSSLVKRVSKFRSGAGHDYADDFESCRSMKHYFVNVGPGLPKLDPDAPRVRILAPADGRVMYVQDERAAYGRQVGFAPDATPGALVILFHVDVAPGTVPGARFFAGDELGAIVPGHGFDVAVLLAAPEGRRLVSYFDVAAESVLDAYRARGADPGALVIPRAERDADPLACDGERFVPQAYRPEDWVDLD